MLGQVVDLSFAIFLGTINVMNVKLCIKLLLTELDLFLPLGVTLTIFQGQSILFYIKQLYS